MTDTLALVSTCTGGILAVAALISLCSDLLFRERAEIQRRLQHEFRPQEKQQKSPLFRDLKMLQAKTGGSSEYSDLWQRFGMHVEQSGLPWSPPQIVWTAMAMSVVTALISGFLISIPVAAALAVVAGIIPFLTVEVFRQRRRALFCQQLPDAFEQMKRSVRAGQTLMTAMQQIAKDFPRPLSDEFAMCCQQHELGLSQTVALQDLARRINVMELRLFVVSALVQRDVGGNFAEILASLSGVVRQRLRLASRVKATTAEGRMQAMVLAALPVIAGLMMGILNPDYTRLLLERPRLLIALILSEVIGVIWIRKIVNFDY